MSATYDNGDESDNWCGSHTPVPPEMLGPQYYVAPQCGTRKYFAIGNKKLESINWVTYMSNTICV
jgi:hypothetical protein